MNIILYGVQGSGKSTQGKMLAKEMKIPYFSMGQILRDIASQDSKLGMEIRKIIDKGLLVPNEKVVRVLENDLSKSDTSKGFILDGFPRTINQIKIFKKRIDCVLYIKLSKKEAIRRLMKREEGRIDDTPESINKRIKIYYNNTKPILDYFKIRGKLLEIDGEQTIKKVQKDIISALQMFQEKKFKIN